MSPDLDLRAGEIAVKPPAAWDAGLTFIGRIRTPWTSRHDCPRQGAHDGPVCTLELFEPWLAALSGVEAYEDLQVLYWMDRARRDLVLQSPANDGATRGTFSIRSPTRPNPIASSIVKLVSVDGALVKVRGLDCLDGTPLLDIKPDRNGFKPLLPERRESASTQEQFMKLSARNQIKGKVAEVTKGQTTAHVRIDIGNGVVITASITNEAIDDLDLKPGDAAIAVIKASDVMVAK